MLEFRFRFRKATIDTWVAEEADCEDMDHHFLNGKEPKHVREMECCALAGQAYLRT